MTRAAAADTPQPNVRPIFTHDIFAVQRYGGISRYACELHRALCARGIESTIAAPLHVSELLEGIPRVIGWRLPSKLQVRGSVRAVKAIDGVVEARALRSAAGSAANNVVVHRTEYQGIPSRRRHPTVVTVHDMIPETYSQFFGERDRLRAKHRWVREADAVIAVSDYTKRELARILDVDPVRVAVCHHGVTAVAPDRAALERLQASPPFVLYVGGRYGYKNFDGFIRAYGATTAAAEGVRAIAYGAPASPVERRLVERENVGEKVSFVSGHDALLAAHYQTALALIYPSLDEGFGMPPLEAMIHGCVVAASAAGAIPEVVGDAALLFEAASDEAMTEAIDRVVGDETLRAQLREAGTRRAAAFSWADTAHTTLSVYRSAICAWDARR
jgi:glycosyltransferase involved in cell wall biosynthesis